MNRRVFLSTGMVATLSAPLFAAWRQQELDQAIDVLHQATISRQIDSAVLHVAQRPSSFTRSFGRVKSEQGMFLLGSISKPICMTALMTLFDRKLFRLDDPVKRFLPRFDGDGRDRITIQHLLTHVSGLPDQLPENAELRKSHAPLSEFVARAMRTPLSFPAGEKYQYSSMGILLAAHIAERISGEEIRRFVDQVVFRPLRMEHSAQGLGRFEVSDMVPMQTEAAAPESGAGDPQAKDWDWNSAYWRGLGAPWGGTHASAADVAKLLAELLHRDGVVLHPETAARMITNQNVDGIEPRGLAFDVGPRIGSHRCSNKTFGHTGSTGTIAWADPETQAICVVLTSLPAQAVEPHPRDRVAAYLASAIGD